MSLPKLPLGLVVLLIIATTLNRMQPSLQAQDDSPHQKSTIGALDWSEIRAKGARRSVYRGRQVENANEITQAGHSEQSEAEIEKRRAENLATFQNEIQPLLAAACFDCHGPDTQEGNVRIDNLDADFIAGSDVDWWLEIQAALSKGEMPPPDSNDLEDGDRGKIINWLSQQLLEASKSRRAGSQQSSFRRMTRYEYNHAMQDLLGLPWDFARDLPPEAASEDGFRNSSESLHMTVQQLETYHRLAQKALQRATVRGEQPQPLYWGVTMKQAAEVDWQKQQNQILELSKSFLKELPNLDPAELEEHKQRQEKAQQELLASFQQVPNVTHFRQLKDGRNVNASWEYYGAKHAQKPAAELQPVPEAFQQIAVLPGGRNRKLTIELGDQIPDEGTLRVRVLAARSDPNDSRIPSLGLEFGWQASNEGRALLPVGQFDHLVTAKPEQPEFYQWDVPLGEIYPRNMVRGQFPMGAMPSPSEYIKLVNSSQSAQSLQIYYVQVIAPVYQQWPPESHRRIFFERSADQSDEDYAAQILCSWMHRAWRRPIQPEEIQRKLQLLNVMRQHSDSFEDAMIQVLATVVSSPDFLYLKSSRGAQQTDQQELTSLQLATRLSMFLWSSIPDPQLLELAEQDRLKDPQVLAAEVQRMLEDDRSVRLSQHFVHQWLDMELLDFLNFQQPGYDPVLKEAMLQEPVVFFQDVLQNNRSVLDFVHADDVIINQRLARHYGINDVQGNHFRKVALQNNPKRGGLLTMSGLLAMNSAGEDSHPLKRGVWLLESILNDPPPPPPPAVPQIDLADPEIAKMTLKERIENHRNHAACYSCHSKIDPWGIAFENYDAKGHWRDQIQGKPIDASSRLFNEQELDGVIGLKTYLLENRQDQLVHAIVYKLATYGLGRPLTFADHAEIDQITADARREGDGLATIIQLLVASPLFQSP